VSQRDQGASSSGPGPRRREQSAKKNAVIAALSGAR
jgi:hypothetical protein